MWYALGILALLFAVVKFWQAVDDALATIEELDL